VKRGWQLAEAGFVGEHFPERLLGRFRRRVEIDE
jgi:hypothetical protein